MVQFKKIGEFDCWFYPHGQAVVGDKLVDEHSEKSDMIVQFHLTEITDEEIAFILRQLTSAYKPKFVHVYPFENVLSAYIKLEVLN